jgi:hypothetical protein
MRQNREAVYNAAYNLLKGITWSFNSTPQQFLYTSRRLLPWSQVNEGQQPAFFLRQLREETRQDVLALPKWRLRAQIWIYMVAAPNAEQSGNWPSQLINPCLDAIEKTLEGPVPGEKQTLGGLVEHCWIDGDIFVDDPVSPDTQIVIVIPISMLTAI